MLHDTAGAYSDALDNITIRHRAYQETYDELASLLTIADRNPGSIIPLLAPTRCGKTELLTDLRKRCETVRQAPGMMLDSSDFAIGRISAKPNDRDLYCAMLSALGVSSGPRDRTSVVRDRLIEFIRKFGIRVIALDEASHCAERGANLSERAAGDHFKTIVDETGVTLILAGLPRFQKLIDGNEQFAARSLKTVSLLPYSWSREEDRQSFNEAVQAAFMCLEEAELPIDLDPEDAVRRLYGVSGGRVGVVLKVLRTSANSPDLQQLSMKQIADAALATVQSHVPPKIYFEETPPSDRDLVNSYFDVMTDAGLDVELSTLQDLAAAQGV